MNPFCLIPPLTYFAYRASPEAIQAALTGISEIRRAHGERVIGKPMTQAQKILSFRFGDKYY
jgi:hypothetical protein